MTFDKHFIRHLNEALQGHKYLIVEETYSMGHPDIGKKKIVQGPNLKSVVDNLINNSFSSTTEVWEPSNLRTNREKDLAYFSIDEDGEGGYYVIQDTSKWFNIFQKSDWTTEETNEWDEVFDNLTSGR
jgi:hypothetical protein